MLTLVIDKSVPNSELNAIARIKELSPTVKHTMVIREFTEKRSELQNKLSHGWYGEMAYALKQDDALGHKCFCKLHFAVPIMRTDDAEFRQAYDLVIKPLPYEKKLQAMKILPVTSIMNTKQLTQYLDAVKAHYWDKHGLNLKYPDDY